MRPKSDLEAWRKHHSVLVLIKCVIFASNVVFLHLYFDIGCFCMRYGRIGSLDCNRTIIMYYCLLNRLYWTCCAKQGLFLLILQKKIDFGLAHFPGTVTVCASVWLQYLF